MAKRDYKDFNKTEYQNPLYDRLSLRMKNRVNALSLYMDNWTQKDFDIEVEGCLFTDEAVVLEKQGKEFTKELMIDFANKLYKDGYKMVNEGMPAMFIHGLRKTVLDAEKDHKKSDEVLLYHPCNHYDEKTKKFRSAPKYLPAMYHAYLEDEVKLAEEERVAKLAQEKSEKVRKTLNPTKRVDFKNNDKQVELNFTKDSSGNVA